MPVARGLFLDVVIFELDSKSSMKHSLLGGKELLFPRAQVPGSESSKIHHRYHKLILTGGKTVGNPM